jgi:hypothetical protein
MMPQQLFQPRIPRRAAATRIPGGWIAGGSSLGKTGVVEMVSEVVLDAATVDVTTRHTLYGVGVEGIDLALESSDTDVFTVDEEVTTDAAGEAEITLTRTGNGEATLTVTAESGAKSLTTVTATGHAP